ncbi:MAG: DUF1062 domain-containing protein [Rhodobacterales bacterium]|nr:MAG: DUF1062 domain-containing protein [Rhodobacterales bacterium]
MSGIVTALWRIAADTPPRPLRHCSTCGQTRPFHSSGKIRLNANGRRLDAWLIYKCSACDRTWTLPLIERAAVASLSVADLAALQHSDPDWVRRKESDLTLLVRHCDRVEPAANASIRKSVDGNWPAPWTVIHLQVVAKATTRQRLDRVLARGFGLSRRAVQEMMDAGGVLVDRPGGGGLHRQLAGTVSLRIIAECLTEGQRAAVTARLVQQ